MPFSGDLDGLERRRIYYFARHLAELASRGVTVRADGETLRLRPKAALDDGLLARVQAHKPDILAVLSGRPATCSPTCYEIEPGRWIHRPGTAARRPYERPQSQSFHLAPIAAVSALCAHDAGCVRRFTAGACRRLPVGIAEGEAVVAAPPVGVASSAR